MRDLPAPARCSWSQSLHPCCRGRGFGFRCSSRKRLLPHTPTPHTRVSRAARNGRERPESRSRGHHLKPFLARRERPPKRPGRHRMAGGQARPPALPMRRAMHLVAGSDQKFAEPVALSPAQPTDRPLPCRAFRLNLDLVALRARRVDDLTDHAASIKSVTRGSRERGPRSSRSNRRRGARPTAPARRGARRGKRPQSSATRHAAEAARGAEQYGGSMAGSVRQSQS